MNGSLMRKAVPPPRLRAGSGLEMDVGNENREYPGGVTSARQAVEVSGVIHVSVRQMTSGCCESVMSYS